MEEMSKGTQLNSGEYFCIPLWICQEEFAVWKDDKRKLNSSEKCVYAFMYTYCVAQRNYNHDYCGSLSDIAKAIGLSLKSVQRSLRSLLNAGLIYRERIDCRKIRYILNYKLVLIKEKKVKSTCSVKESFAEVFAKIAKATK